MLTFLPAAARRPQPWKNGGGSTTPIASHPEGAGLEAFDWRISMARVEADGPFSHFPDIDRSLGILDGEGVTLDIEGQEVSVTRGGPPASFPGDRATHARLIAGAVTDLNVMTRRGRFQHSLRRLVVDGVQALGGQGAVLVVLSLGLSEIRVGDARQRLSFGDAGLLRPRRDRPAAIATAAATTVWVASIEPAVA